MKTAYKTPETKILRLEPARFLTISIEVSDETTDCFNAPMLYPDDEE